MLMYCLLGLCIFPNMVMNENIARKSEKKEKNNRLLLTIFRYHIHGLWIFPNIVNNTNIVRKTEKKEKE